MSNIVHVACQKRKVGSPTVKAVLMYMSDRAADDGSGIWTSKSTMADDLEMSKRTVQNAIAELISRGLISEAGSRKCDRGFTVDYTINLAMIEKLESTRKEAKSTGESPAPVQHVHPKGCSTFTPTGESPAPNTSLEPSLEPSNAREGLFTNLPAIIPQPAPDLFAEFWEAYPKCPRKTDRPKAKALFEKIIAGKHAAIGKTDGAEIVQAVRRYASTNPDPQYVPLPTTWLNGERWTQFQTEAQAEDPDVAAQRARLRAITENARAANQPRQ